MVSQKEKTHAKKWLDHLKDDLNIWGERLIDTPYLSESGYSNYKKPFDALVCCKGLAIEFKFKTGKTFNVKAWKKSKRTRHQFKNLIDFSESNSGIAILFVFWKQAGKRDIQKKWIRAVELKNRDKVKYEDMLDVKQLEVLIKSWSQE